MKLKTLVCLSLITLCASLVPAAHAQTFSVIHAFTGGVDGAGPSAGVTIRGGILYGTTTAGAYQITHSGSNWTTVPISSLSGGYPLARVIFGPDSHPYGTTETGSNGVGNIFNLVPPLSICKAANCSWNENVVYSFLNNGRDGAGPQYGDLTWDQMGNIYGTTQYGGLFGYGIVYELQRSGNGWTESVLYSFSGTDGAYPQNEVIFDKNGNLFGTTENGGAQGNGNIFELQYVIGLGWTANSLYDFQNGADGQYPIAGLVSDTAGNLYGATTQGGVGRGGAIFELSPSGNGAWTFNLLHSFSEGVGCGPRGTLVMDAIGNLYGASFCDGVHNSGNVFKLSNTENGWVYTSLYDFTGGSDGWIPIGKVTFDSSGNLYGTTFRGGNFGGRCDVVGCGIVWMITP